MVDAAPRETTHGAVARELRSQRSEHILQTRKAEAFQRLGYRTVEDAASKRLFQQRFQAEFPNVLGKRAINPDEMNNQIRGQIQPPECVTLESATGERMWALSFGDRLTVVVGSEPTTKLNVDGKTEGTVYPMKSFLIGSRKGGGQVIDALSMLRSYEERWGRTLSEPYLSFGYMDPYFFPGDGDEREAIIMSLSMTREGKKPVIDVDETINTLIHEGSHAARRGVDSQIGEEEAISVAPDALTKKVARERGAHALGLLLAHRLRDFVDVRSYRRSMKSSLASYDRNFPEQRAKVGRAAYALTAHRNALGQRN